MAPIKRTVFLPTVTVLKNTVRLIGNIEYIQAQRYEAFRSADLPDTGFRVSTIFLR